MKINVANFCEMSAFFYQIAILYVPENILIINAIENFNMKRSYLKASFFNS
jgi:hypothetical protein